MREHLLPQLLVCVPLFVFQCSGRKRPWSTAHGGSFPEGPLVVAATARTVLVSLRQVLCRSKNRILKECFLVAELENRRRSPTVSGKNARANWRGGKNHPEGTLTSGHLPFPVLPLFWTYHSPTGSIKCMFSKLSHQCGHLQTFIEHLLCQALSWAQT